jgi:tetratricopeptide (TPR) repeat protein
MTKAMHRAPPLAAPAELAERGIESMRLGHFKDAIEALKQLVQQDARPEWRQRLVDAYAGRACSLADKGMFKEAAIVFENTLTPDGMIREPALYLNCLIRLGQHQKAARLAQRCVSGGGPSTDGVVECAAALSLAAPPPTEPPSPVMPPAPNSPAPRRRR